MPDTKPASRIGIRAPCANVIWCVSALLEIDMNGRLIRYLAFRMKTIVAAN